MRCVVPAQIQYTHDREANCLQGIGKGRENGLRLQKFSHILNLPVSNLRGFVFEGQLPFTGRLVATETNNSNLPRLT